MSTNVTNQTLYFNSEKKHSVRYDCAPGSVKPMLTSIYVGKDSFVGKAFPRAVIVTVTAIEIET